MATRKFDYAAIKDVYESMIKTIGSSGESGTIAGTLTELDKEVHDRVNVCDEAIFGPLANQLLLDWENVSSNFPTFIESFSNWSKLVALSAGDYGNFEDDVKGFKDVNPLGVTSGGASTNYVDASNYSSYTDREIDIMKDSIFPYLTLTGATVGDLVTTSVTPPNTIDEGTNSYVFDGVDTVSGVTTLDYSSDSNNADVVTEQPNE